jgi:hypothetical protein
MHFRIRPALLPATMALLGDGADAGSWTAATVWVARPRLTCMHKVRKWAIIMAY